jgi:hypothetical protein
MKKLFYLMVVVLTVFASCVEDEEYVPPTAEAGDIVLNEIMSKDPVTDLDWIELYNKSEVEVDISGYLVNDKADPNGGFEIPAGSKIAAKGYFVLNEGDDFTFGISSGGEDVSLGDADGNLIDLASVPASPADGTTYGRITDGGDEWIGGMTATKGASNSSEIETVNGFYGLIVNNIEGEDMTFDVNVYYPDGDLTEIKFYYVINYDAETMWYDDDADAGTPDVFDTDTYREDIELDVTAGNGTYKFTIPSDTLFPGDVVSWYMRAKDPSGEKMYFTEGKTAVEFDGDIKDDPATWATVERLGSTIPDGTVNGFSNLSIDNTAGADVVVSIDVNYDYGDLDEIKLYYVINYDAATMWYDDDNDAGTPDVFDTDTYRVDIELDVTAGDGTYAFNIPASEITAGDEISWYMRAKDPLGEKMYFTGGKTADEFDGDTKDDPANWAVYTVK